MDSESAQASADWIFAYGSLIWRPGFTSAAVQPARVAGYERRFWQASHDHRGTPEYPGRVVTLAPMPASFCDGLAYQMPATQRDAILEMLDHREQDGYERVFVELIVAGGERVRGVTWIALAGNPSWVGWEATDRVADLIATRHGPSGSNREYLYRLNQALVSLDIADPYIATLTHRVQNLVG